MTRRSTMVSLAIAFGLLILGVAGLLFNPKPPEVPAAHGDDMVTSAAAGRAGAMVSPTDQR